MRTHGKVMEARDAALAKMRRHIGAKAVRYLRAGKAVLCCWRGSTPYNYYIETTARHVTLWHSSGWGDKPDLACFDVVADGDGIIPVSTVHRSGGLSFKTTYVLKPQYL